MVNLWKIYVNTHNNLAQITKKTIMNYKQRMMMYRMLEKMTGEPATLQINEAIEELKAMEVNKDLKSRLWYVYDDVMEQMRNSDADFAKAISKYIPQQDTMIISASEQDDITIGFATVIENNIKISMMKKAFYSALAYPVMMLGILMLLLYYFSVKVIPAFVDNMPNGVILSSSSELLVKLTHYFNWWFFGLVIFLAVLIGWLTWALPNMISKHRSHLEELPPFNMYRIMIGCGFLFALNSLGKAGFMQIASLEQMLSLARPYLRYRIEVIMDLMADGNDIGQALIISKLNFPDKQMVRELAIQVKYSSDDSLEVLSNTLAADGLEAIKNQAQGLRFIVTMIVFGTIGFLYFSVYQFGIDLSNVKT